jgi:hypothetical protein
MNWYFEELSHSKTLRAVEPDGTVHTVAIGDMNSLAGIRLLNAMVRDLTKKEAGNGETEDVPDNQTLPIE